MIKSRIHFQPLILVAILLISGCTSEKPEGDLALTNGTIATMNKNQPKAEALVTAGDTILAVGSIEEMDAYIGPSTKVIDLAGRLAVPGFIEAHGHFLGIGEMQKNLDLRDITTWNQIVEKVDSAANDAQPGEWIQGRGWHQEKWSTSPKFMVRGFPTNKRLNEVAPETPVYLKHTSGHAAIVNQAALRAAGITRKTSDPKGGDIVRDELGRATGVVLESAEDLVIQALKKSRSNLPAKARRKLKREKVRLAANQALKNGVTSFHDQGASFETIRLYRKMAQNGNLDLRMYAMIEQSAVTPENRPKLSKIRTIGTANHHLTVRAIGEITVDGALGSHSAWMLKPYKDAPGNTGINVTSMNRVRKIAKIGLEENFQIAVHAIGDRANRETLDLFASIFDKYPVNGKKLRWRIEHAQHLHPADIPRFAKLGVIASMQGIHACMDASYNYKRLGKERVHQGAYAWRSLQQSGTLIANGTDAPFVPLDPLANMHCTVTRRVPGSDTTFTADETLSRMQALRSYTINNAYAAFEEDIKGSLETGKLADITILSQNILKGPAERIRNVKVDLTLVGGKVLYRRNQ